MAEPNVASHRVLEKAGFTHTHDTEDARWYALRRDGAGSLGWGS